MDDAGVERADRQHDASAAPGASCRAAARRTARPGGSPYCGSRNSATDRAVLIWTRSRAAAASACGGPARPRRASAPRAPADARHRAADRRAARAPARARRRRRPAPRFARSSALGRARPLPEHDRHQLVVAERRRAEALQLLTRPIVRRDRLHRTPSLLYFRCDALVGPSCCARSAALRSCCPRPVPNLPRKKSISAQARDRRGARRRRGAVRARTVHRGDDRAAADRTTPSRSATIAWRCRAPSTPASARRRRRGRPPTARRARAAKRKRRSAPPAPRCCSSTRDSRRPRLPGVPARELAAARATAKDASAGSAKSGRGAERGELRGSGRGGQGAPRADSRANRERRARRPRALSDAALTRHDAARPLPVAMRYRQRLRHGASMSQVGAQRRQGTCRRRLSRATSWSRRASDDPAPAPARSRRSRRSRRRRATMPWRIIAVIGT